MTYLRYLTLIVAGAGVLSACALDDLQYQGRYCSQEWPCADGLRCVNSACVALSGDSAIVDARGDVKQASDLKNSDGKLAPKPDRPPDLAKPPDLPPKPDLPPAPDAGCPAGKVACGTQCVDTMSSFAHCGTCFKPCLSAFSDRCEAGKCHCGSFGPLCTAGLSCVKGVCACVSGPLSSCKGCCQNNTCQLGSSTAACGAGGVACKLCVATTCRTPSCSKGSCGSVLKLDGSSCVVKFSGGKCFKGVCCTGCWTGTKCEPGTSTLACGRLGNGCKACLGVPAKKCSNGVCI